MGVASINSVRLAVFAVTLMLLYHGLHDIHPFTHAFLQAEVSSPAGLENLALRHQLEVLEQNAKRPCLPNRDRIPWVILSRFWSDWQEPLTFVRTETVIR